MMKRILSLSLLALVTASAYACSNSKKDDAKAVTPTPDEGPTAEPTLEDAGAPPTEDAAGVAPPPPPPGTEDPSGNPILLGLPRTVRTFLPPDGQPAFVDGPQWSVAKDAIFVALPYETNLQGGKGILTTFKSDGTNYTELRAGDKTVTGVVGNSVDGQGNLISAELKAITRTSFATGAVTTIALGYSGTAVDADGGAILTPFDGPNDLIGLKDGTIFFTDPGYNITPRPLVGHLFKIDPAGTAKIAVAYEDNPSPNGIATTKDEKFLFVSFTAPANTPAFVRKYAIQGDRTLQDLGKFVELPQDSEADGMAIDDEDNLLVAVNTGIAAFKPTGEPFGGPAARIPQTLIAGGVSALTYGGADRKSLFVCTAGKLLELRTKIPGLIQ